MLNSRFRALAAVMAFATAALAGCGGGGDGGDGNASVRLVNATLTHASLDLLANSATIVTGTATDTASELRQRRRRQPVAAGQRRHHRRRPGDHRADGHRRPEVRAPRLRERRRGAHRRHLRGHHAAGLRHGDRARLQCRDRCRLDRRLRHRSGRRHHDPVVADLHLHRLDARCRRATSSRSAPGTYRIRVTGAGNPSDLRLDIPSRPGQPAGATVILTPTAGGTLANGSVLIEDGRLHRHPQHQRPRAPGRRGHRRRLGLGRGRAASPIAHQRRRAGGRHLRQRAFGQRRSTSRSTAPRSLRRPRRPPPAAIRTLMVYGNAASPDRDPDRRRQPPADGRPTTTSCAWSTASPARPCR